jgi:hypothetical protein
LLSKNLNIKICRPIIWGVFCVGVQLGRSRWGRNVGWGWVFENTALRRILGLKRDEVTGECCKLHNE